MRLFKQKENADVALIEKLNKPHGGDKLVLMDDRKLVIDVKNVKKTYTNGTVISNILKGVDLQVYDGDFVVVLGPSGSGKTTLMNIISGLDRGTDGDIHVLGNNLINLNDDELTKFRRINIGYIFQQYGLIPNLKVHENITIGSYLNNLNKKEVDRNLKFELNILNKQKKIEISNTPASPMIDCSKYIDSVPFMDYMYYAHYYFDKKVVTFLTAFAQYAVNQNDAISLVLKKYEHWQQVIRDRYEDFRNTTFDETIYDIMETLGIEKLKDKYPTQLSGGQQQRVSIARVFAKKPKIIFADEPTGAVDLEMSNVILKAFQDLNRKYNTTIMIVTHNPDIAKLATKVVQFKDGNIESVINQPQNNV